MALPVRDQVPPRGQDWVVHTNQLPMYQILRIVYWQARKQMERRVDKEVCALRFGYEISNTVISGDNGPERGEFGSRVVRLTLVDECAEPNQLFRTRDLALLRQG